MAGNQDGEWRVEERHYTRPVRLCNNPLCAGNRYGERCKAFQDYDYPEKVCRVCNHTMSAIIGGDNGDAPWRGGKPIIQHPWNARKAPNREAGGKAGAKGDGKGKSKGEAGKGKDSKGGKQSKGLGGKGGGKSGHAGAGREGKGKGADPLLKASPKSRAKGGSGSSTPKVGSNIDPADLLEAFMAEVQTSGTMPTCKEDLMSFVSEFHKSKLPASDQMNDLQSQLNAQKRQLAHQETLITQCNTALINTRNRMSRLVRNIEEAEARREEIRCSINCLGDQMKLCASSGINVNKPPILTRQSSMQDAMAWKDIDPEYHSEVMKWMLAGMFGEVPKPNNVEGDAGMNEDLQNIQEVNEEDLVEDSGSEAGSNLQVFPRNYNASSRSKHQFGKQAKKSKVRHEPYGGGAIDNSDEQASSSDYLRCQDVLDRVAASVVDFQQCP